MKVILVKIFCEVVREALCKHNKRHALGGIIPKNKIYSWEYLLNDFTSHLLLNHNIPINDFNRPYKAQNVF